MTNAEKLIDEVEQSLSDSFGQWLDAHGGKQSIGRAFGMLLVQPEPLSLTTLAEKCHISKPAMSNAAASATQLELIKKVFNKDSPREDFYECKPALLENILASGTVKVESMFKFFEDALEKMPENPDFLEKETEETRRKYLEMRDIIKFHLDSYNMIKKELADFYAGISQKVSAIYKEKFGN